MRWLRYMRFEMPLLGKELTELAAQRRTYVIRVVSALALYAFFLWTFLGNGLGEVYRLITPMQAMGMGQRMFEFLAVAQFLGILVFLPITVATSITREKERGTLDLLMLTDMNRWTLVLQKYLGGMIPLWSLMLLTAPLMAVAYAMGGVDTGRFVTVEVSLVMFSLQMGALAIAASAYCYTTVGALVRYYVLAFCYMAACGGGTGIGRTVPMAGIATRSGYEVYFLVGWIVFNLILTFLLLAASVRYLVKRAHPKTRTSWIGGVSKIQRFGREFSLVTSRLAGVGSRAANGYQKPEKREFPVGRGTSLRAFHLETKRSLWTYLWWEMQIPSVVGFGMIGLVAIGTITGFMVWFGEDDSPLHSTVVIGMLLVSSLWVIVVGSQLIPNERMNGTLDVLLTTPMSGREIIAYKMRELWRVIMLLVGFTGAICLMEAWVEHSFDSWRGWRDALVYLLGSIGLVALTTVNVTWLVVGVGLRFQSRLKALMIALVMVVAWVAGPLLIWEMGILPWEDSTNILLFHVISPGLSLDFVERFMAKESSLNPMGLVCLSLLVQSSILWGVRWLVLRNADRWLGRATEPGKD